MSDNKGPVGYEWELALLADTGHRYWVDAWREAADWRDQYRMERDEARELLRSLLEHFPAMSGPALEIAALLFDADSETS